MDLINEFGHILKGSEPIIEKGRELAASISIPKGYELTDALLYQLGAGTKDLKYVEDTEAELSNYIKTKNKYT